MIPDIVKLHSVRFGKPFSVQQSDTGEEGLLDENFSAFFLENVNQSIRVVNNKKMLSYKANNH